MNWPWSRHAKQPGWLAVSLRPGELSYVHGHCSPGSTATVDRCGTRQLEGEFGGAEQAAKELGFDRFQCSTVLASGEYQLLLVDAPNVPQAELKTAIRWRIKDMLDYHAQDATVDVLTVPSNPAGGDRASSMYAVTARNDLIQGCIERFEGAHIPLTVIDIVETSQRNIAALFEQDGRGLAMLYIGRDQSMLTVNFRRELMLARRIEVSAADLESGAGSGREEAFQRVLLELQRTLDHFDRQFSYAPIAKLLLGPQLEETGLLEFLAGNLDLPVERAHLSGVISFGADAELEPADEWRLFHLIGASLRHDAKAL